MIAKDSTDPTCFVVLFEGRSGSTYLMESLASHPEIHAEKEILAALKKQVRRGVADIAVQVESVEALFGAGQHNCRAVGFKTKIKDVLDRGAFLQALRDFHTKVILLQRQNRIKLLISLLNAMQLNEMTGDWNLYDESNRQSTMHVDVSTFRQWLDKMEQGNRELNDYAKQLGLPILKVYYEDIWTDSRTTFEQICRFLGVGYQRLSGSCLKNTSDDLREVVENFGELKECFQNTHYEPMFDEVLRPQT